MRKQANQVGGAHAVDIELGALQGAHKLVLGALKEVQSLDRIVRVATLLGQTVQRPNAGAGIVDGGKELEVAAVAAEQDLAQVDQAVDRLLQRGEFAGAATFAMFHRAVVLEKGHVVHGRLDPEHQADLVIHLHLRLLQTMLDAGALDTGLETRSDFLGELRGNFLVEEGGDLLSLDCEHRLARELLGLEGVGELLRGPPALDAYEGVVREGGLDALGFGLAGQPAVVLAVKLKPKGPPGRYPQIAQPHHWVQEVVVQAFARLGLEEGLVACVVVPGLVAPAGLHRRDDVHQPRMIPAPLEHPRYHLLLANVFDLNARRGRQLPGTGADRIPQWLSKPGVIENADAPRLEKCRHSLCVICSRQGARHHQPAVTGEHPVQPTLVPLNQPLRHRSYYRSARAYSTSSCLAPAMPA